MKSAENQLKQGAEHDNRQQRGNDFADVIRQGVHKFRRDLTGVLKVGNSDLRVAGVAARVENAEQQDREHRADAAQRDETEAVVLCAAVAADRRKTDTERHDERNSDRAGGDAARVERD